MKSNQSLLAFMVLLPFLMQVAMGCMETMPLLEEPPQDNSSYNNARNKPLFVFIHGLAMTADYCEELSTRLKEELALQDDQILRLQSAEGCASLCCAIRNQAAKAVQEIQDTLKHSGKEPQSPIILIGHSQGGVRACSIAAGAASNGQLNIQGVVTLTAPLEGVPIMHTTPCGAANFLCQAWRGLSDVGLWSKRLVAEMLCVSYIFTSCKCCCLGLYDLSPQSSRTQKTKSFLGTTQIPVLCIGGNQNDFSAIFKVNTASVSQLNKAYGELIGGEKHDTLLPLSSQTAEKVESATTVQTCELEKTMHAANIVPLGTECVITKENCINEITSSAETIQRIVAFIKESCLTKL